MLIEFFRVRSTDDSHAMGRISVAADDLEAARVKAKPQDALVARCFLSLSMRVKRLFNCHCEMVPAVVQSLVTWGAGRKKSMAGQEN